MSADLVEALVEAVEAWTSTLPHGREVDAAKRIDPAILKSARDMGLFGLTLPDEYGGTGLSLADAIPVIAAIARHDRSLATTLGLHLGLGTRGLVLAGTPEQKARWLPLLASGEIIASFAATEPDAGSDLSRLGTRTRRVGEQIVVNGAKVYVTNGGFAGLYTVLTATPDLAGGWGGRALVLVPRGTPGVIVGPEEDKLGLRGSSTTSVYFEDVTLDSAQAIGDFGHAHALLAEVLAWGRTMMAAGCCGMARAALNLARTHTASRRQFGRSLDGIPVVQAQLVDMEARWFAMEALVDAAARSAPGEERERTSLAAKVFASDGASIVIDRALQLHGGLGFIEESGIPLLYRDVRVTRIFEGANDVLLTRLGAMALTRPGVSDIELACGRQREAAIAACLSDRARAIRDPVRQHRLGVVEVSALASAAARDHAVTPGEQALAVRIDRMLLGSPSDLDFSAPGPESAARPREMEISS